MTNEEWERRYKARIVEVLRKPQESDFKEFGLPDDIMSLEEAQEIAQDEFESVALADHVEFYKADPEGAADEEMSYWGEL